ncbi:PREDICTED: alpha-1,3/1,6-mannosyltransferase ALG2 [Ceratosolen solmsi marchali]|uniref:Alpha-1,3/1,6-mannosyltransferase ALG2 n=1 Tax=Ceratosolen solmsi marchali TaxID=326594 RepID=A0AAJ7E1B1_9HYME|nr:PREDICTED: alpha-1,3/1,6-mannosyltransferase ALG2 [Ceratosolen solmsi marchali]
MHVTFLHPDLGIGGAERLVVDAALALKENGQYVDFVTTHHDPNHCFTETKDGTFKVTVVGDWLPRHIFGKFFAFCAYVRMIWAALYIIFQANHPDIVFCDLVSICIPFLKLCIPVVIFYCHHPDQLLTSSESRLKKFYRLPLNFFEEITTGLADKIFVNSLYTKSVYKQTFRRLNADFTEVLYPSINTSFFDQVYIFPLERILDKRFNSDTCFLLSINRYERKKELSIAIKALADLKKYLSLEEYANVYLIMAGGYDKRVEENVEYYLELIGLADELGVTEKVFFLRSPTDAEKVSILVNCDILIYTPPNEHFGIVPLEAMYVSKPVIAHNSGGPKESIINNVTGYLVEKSTFSEKLSILVKNKSLRLQFGAAGKKYFIDKFSFKKFSNCLISSILDTYINKNQ